MTPTISSFGSEIDYGLFLSTFNGVKPHDIGGQLKTLFLEIINSGNFFSIINCHMQSEVQCYPAETEYFLD